MIRDVGESLARRGQRAAKEWLQSAKVNEVTRLAEFPFEFSHTALDDLRSAAFAVPKSPDLHFSSAFRKQVNSHADGSERADPSSSLAWARIRKGPAWALAEGNTLR